MALGGGGRFGEEEAVGVGATQLAEFLELLRDAVEKDSRTPAAAAA